MGRLTLFSAISYSAYVSILFMSLALTSIYGKNSIIATVFYLVAIICAVEFFAGLLRLIFVGQPIGDNYISFKEYFFVGSMALALHVAYLFLSPQFDWQTTQSAIFWFGDARFVCNFSYFVAIFAILTPLVLVSIQVGDGHFFLAFLIFPVWALSILSTLGAYGPVCIPGSFDGTANGTLGAISFAIDFMIFGLPDEVMGFFGWQFSSVTFNSTGWIGGAAFLFLIYCLIWLPLLFSVGERQS